MSTLSLVDAAGALRDAKAQYDALANKKNVLSVELSATEVQWSKAYDDLMKAQEDLLTVASAPEVTIL
jgi:hypothetical protein